MNNVTGMKILKTLCNFVELENCVKMNQDGGRKAYEFLNICAAVIFEIVQNGAVLHPWGDRAKR